MAYAPPGELLAMQGDNLIAVPFDLDSYEVGGGGVVVANGVLHSRNNGYAAFSVSSEGTLVYARAGMINLPSTLQWFDRAGESTPVPIEPAPFFGWLRLAPDGKRAAATLPGTTGDGEVWIVDLVRGVRTRLTPSAPWEFGRPIWSPAGDRVLFTSPKLGSTDFFVRNADGSGDEQAVLTDKQDKQSYDWAPDGRQIAYWPIGAGALTADLWIHDLETKESAVVIAGEPSYVDACFSPDSRYLAYASDESGRPEIFVQEIKGGARSQVSTGGGGHPHWSADGREIVYLDPENRMVAVAVDITGAVTLGTPRVLFTVDKRIVGFDATADHSRFLFATRDDTASEPLHVVLNWHADL
jgi:dipeptidyl aminopeptidase/acylaminoacyl peptidase